MFGSFRSLNHGSKSWNDWPFRVVMALLVLSVITGFFVLLSVILDAII